MRRLARAFASRIGDKYLIRLTRSNCTHARLLKNTLTAVKVLYQNANVGSRLHEDVSTIICGLSAKHFVFYCMYMHISVVLIVYLRKYSFA